MCTLHNFTVFTLQKNNLDFVVIDLLILNLNLNFRFVGLVEKIIRKVWWGMSYPTLIFTVLA